MRKQTEIEVFSATPKEIEKAMTGNACKMCADGGKPKHRMTDWVCLRCHIVRKAYAKSLQGEVAIVYKLF